MIPSVEKAGAGPELEIPLVDLKWQHFQVQEDIQKGWDAVTSDTSFILGDDVKTFENEFASYVGVEHCIGVGNGTDALELALRSLDIGAGDEVIVPTNSFVASAVAVVRAGARPVLVDVDPDTHLIDLRQVKLSMTSRTRAVMPVDLYGQMAPLEGLCDLLGDTGVHVVEDAAQAHGSRRHGMSMAQLSTVAATSFYPGKNLGAYGDGGAVLTNDDNLASRVRRLRNLGSSEKGRHDLIGFNSRLDSIQAVVLRAKLARLDEWNGLRKVAADRYLGMLEQTEIIEFPQLLEGNQPNWHLFVIRIPNRDSVLESLHRRGVNAGIHYRTPIHRQPAFASSARATILPVAERLAREILSLPLYPGISVFDQERVVSALLEAIS